MPPSSVLLKLRTGSIRFRQLASPRVIPGGRFFVPVKMLVIESDYTVNKKNDPNNLFFFSWNFFFGWNMGFLKRESHPPRNS